MDTDALFEVLARDKPLDGAFKAELESMLTVQMLPKDHLLVEPGKISDFIWFLQEGFVQSFSFLNGKRVTGEFWKSRQIIVSCNSLFERVPSSETIQLMTQCDLLCISYEQMQLLFTKYPEATTIYRLMMNRHYQNTLNRMFDLTQLTARQRFDKLTASFPHIEQLVSQDSIASYIGVEPQSLSRMKRKWKAASSKANKK